MPDETSQLELLSSAQDRARRLREALQRQEAELAADKLLDPAVRDAGLRAVRCAADCAERLAALAGQAMTPARADATPTAPISDRGAAR